LKGVVSISNNLYGELIQHKDCEICKSHPNFNLKAEIFVHGEYYTKRQILENQEIIDRIKAKLFLYKDSADPVEIILKEILGEIK